VLQQKIGEDNETGIMRRCMDIARTDGICDRWCGNDAYTLPPNRLDWGSVWDRASYRACSSKEAFAANELRVEGDVSFYGLGNWANIFKVPRYGHNSNVDGQAGFEMFRACDFGMSESSIEEGLANVCRNVCNVSGLDGADDGDSRWLAPVIVQQVWNNATDQAVMCHGIGNDFTSRYCPEADAISGYGLFGEVPRSGDQSTAWDGNATGDIDTGQTNPQWPQPSWGLHPSFVPESTVGIIGWPAYGGGVRRIAQHPSNSLNHTIKFVHSVFNHNFDTEIGPSGIQWVRKMYVPQVDLHTGVVP
jgi:hypothetical protein